MPGIFGAFFKDCEDHTAIDTLMDHMAGSMNHNGNCVVDKVVDPEQYYGAGRVSLSIFNQSKQPVYNREKTVAVIFHGELYNCPVGINDPEYVLERYIKEGVRCVDDFEGIFHFFVWDKRDRTVHLISDRFGLYPLYYARANDIFLFAGEVKALLKCESINRSPDYESVGDFFHFGQILGQKTLFRDIKLLPPAAILTFKMEGFQVILQKYWELEAVFSEKGNYGSRAGADTAVECLIESIQRNTKDFENLGLSLSGGLDSRGILAGLQNKSQGLSTYTLGLEGCADQKLSAQMADIAGTNHEFIVLNQLYISDFENMAIQMTKFSDGMYHPHESTEMLALEYFRRADFKILLRGHGGEIAKAALAYPVMVRPEVFSMNSSSQILNYIYDQANLVLRDIDPGKLFRKEHADVFCEAPFQSLEASCLKASERILPPDLCLFYYINEHIRRQVVASLDIFRTEVEIRMPYISKDFLQALLRLPVKERYTGEIHYRLVEKCMPSLLKVNNSNTGAPMDAGAARLFLTDKLNSVLKKMNIKGFRHYTQFQKWYRQGFKERNERIIFSSRTGERGLYDMAYVKKVYNDHIDGKKNYGHFLGTLIGIEMWFRVFVDQE